MVMKYINDMKGEYMIKIAELSKEEIESFNKKINASWVLSFISTLGGPENACLCIKIALQPKENWANGIYQNAPGAIFWFHQDGRLEQSYSSIKPNFRMTRADTLDTVIEKINAYIKKVLDTEPGN